MAEDTADTEAAAAPRCIRCIGPDPDPRTMRIAPRHQRIIITTAMASASPQES
jgi:hypothetical protein